MRAKVKNSDHYKSKFIEKAKLKHGDKYQYHKVEYVNSITKVEIVCNSHGSFFVRPDAHVRKVGCPVCNGGVKYDISKFIEKANQVHDDFYNYDMVNYVNSTNKVIIICPEHGQFKMAPANHLIGQKCPSCSGVKRKTTKDFIIEARGVHNQRYDYSLCKYKNNRFKVDIICPKHGKFKQSPKEHLNGHGCKMCQISHGEEKIENMLKTLRLNFEREYRFEDPVIKNLPFDFYLKDIEILVEYDGRQHFEPVDAFGGEQAFERLKKNDMLRNEWCEKNNIELVRISFNDEDKGFEKLRKAINLNINLRKNLLNIINSNGPVNIDPQVLITEYERGPSKKSENYLTKSFLDIDKSIIVKKELEKFISENFTGPILTDHIIDDIDFDFYLSDRKIGIKILSNFADNELNVPKFQQQKRSNIKDIVSIQIFDDIWLSKKEIIKSRILNILNKNKFHIYARKCELVELSTKECSNFLNENHSQGNIGSSIKIGLKYNNELVSVMTFGKRRKNLGAVSNENSWELLRFCNKKMTSVVGSASKLFKYFLRTFDPNHIVSYADKCWSSDSNVYKQIGMKFVHQSDPSYFYIVGEMRKGRFAYRKDQLLLCGYSKKYTEHNICLNNLIFRIYDAGTFKYEWRK